MSRLAYAEQFVRSQLNTTAHCRLVLSDMLHLYADIRNKGTEVTVTWAVLYYCACIVDCCIYPEKHCGLLLDLIHELVELAQNVDDSSHSDVAMEAGRCLGVIGIIDIGLVTPCGRPANSELEAGVSAMHDSPEMQQYCHMFHALADYLTDSELVIVLLYFIIIILLLYCCKFIFVLRGLVDS